MDTILVSMRRSYVYQGKAYGPGSEVRVPVGLQEAMHLPIVEPSVPVANTQRAPLMKISELAGHLETLDLEGVLALQASDDRAKATPLFEARIAALKSGAGNTSPTE